MIVSRLVLNPATARISQPASHLVTMSSGPGLSPILACIFIRILPECVMVDRLQWSRVHFVYDLRRILKVVSSQYVIDFCTSLTSLRLTDSGVESSNCGPSFLLYSFLSVLPLVFTFLFLLLPSIFVFPTTYLFISRFFLYFLFLFLI